MTEIQRLDAIPGSAQVVQELANLLDGIRLYGRERQIEDILKILDLPAIHPCTIILVGPPESCPSRFLTGFANLLNGQQVPIAQVNCRPASRDIPNGLLVSLLSGFFNAYPKRRLMDLIGMIVQIHSWLGWYFPVLRVTHDPPPIPPSDPTVINHVLEVVLQSIVRELPHLAIIHHLHEADAESLATLRTLQEIPQQGLRLLASVDPVAGERNPVWVAFSKDLPEPMLLPPLTMRHLRAYLGEVAEELEDQELVKRLFEATNGQPLAIETTLRAWVLDGVLARGEEGWVITFPEAPEAEPERETVDAESSDAGKVEAEQATDEEEHNAEHSSSVTAQVDDLLDHLGQAALVDTTTLTFLSMLWRLPFEETTSLLERGRLLGYLAEVHEDDPERVDFSDLDHQHSLIARLSLEQQLETYEAIAALRKEIAERQLRHSALPAEQGEGSGEPLLTAAAPVNIQSLDGRETLSDSYLASIREQLRNQLWASESADFPSDMSHFTWDIPAPQEVTDEARESIIEVAQAIRLAGIQYRLYPLHGRPVIERTEQAMASLKKLLGKRTSLTITCNGDTLAFDGEVITCSQMNNVNRDYLRWMQVGRLQAIGFARGVQVKELARFLEVLITHEPSNGYLSLLSKIIALDLTHIKVLTWYFIQLATDEVRDEAPQEPSSFTHESILEFLANGAEKLPELAAGESPAGGQDATSDEEETIADDFLITNENWRELPERLIASPPSVRGVLTANLLQWVRGVEDESLLQEVDAFVCRRLEDEDDSGVLADTVLLAVERIEDLLLKELLKLAQEYLRVASSRYARDTDPLAHQAMADLLAGVCAGPAFGDWLKHAEIDTPAGEKSLRGLTVLLGEFAVRQLLEWLRQLESKPVDDRLLRLWALLGDGKQSMLIKELRSEQPWQYYRSLLQVLEEHGTPESLGAISEKCVHPYPIVRVAALTAAAAIAREQAVPYIARALTDTDITLCTLAATLAGEYPHPRLQAPLLALLWPASRGADNEPAQLAACAALAKYNAPEVRKALVQIMHPSPLTFAGKPGISLQCAALAALAHHRGNALVRQVIQRARSHRDSAIRAAAEDAWQVLENAGADEEVSE